MNTKELKKLVLPGIILVPLGLMLCLAPFAGMPFDRALVNGATISVLSFALWRWYL